MSQQGGSTSTTSSGAAADAAAGIHISNRSWRRIGSGLALAGMAGLTAVALGELDRLIRASPPAGWAEPRPERRPLAVGPTKTDSWTLWTGAALHEQLGSWIVVSALLDLLLVVALALLLLRIVGLVYRERRQVPTIVLAVYVGPRDSRTCSRSAAAGRSPPENGGAATAIGSVMAGATIVKWLALIVFFVAILRIEPYRRVLARRLSQDRAGGLGASPRHAGDPRHRRPLVHPGRRPARPAARRAAAVGGRVRVGARRARRGRPHHDGDRHVRAGAPAHPVPRPDPCARAAPPSGRVVPWMPRRPGSSPRRSWPASPSSCSCSPSCSAGAPASTCRRSPRCSP